MAQKFRKKPVVIEAVQFKGEENVHEVHAFTGHFVHPEDGETCVFHVIDDMPDRGGDAVVALVWDKLHSTWVGVKKGQWIIKGVQGEFYPCDEEVFANTYDKAGW